MMPGKKKKIVVVSTGPDVPPELAQMLAEQAMAADLPGMEQDEMEENEEENENEDEDGDEDGDDPLEKELMSVIKRIVESCQ